jgi:putative FmdB family regulatory protein
MPTYVFKCVPNDHQFEIQLGFADPSPTECIVCGGSPVKKVFTPVGVTFKGSGFYKTDSRGSSTSPAGSKAAGDGSSTSSTSGSDSSTSTAPSTPPSASTPSPSPSSAPASTPST